MWEALDQYVKQYVVMFLEELKLRVMKGVDQVDQCFDMGIVVFGFVSLGFNWMGVVLMVLLIGVLLFLYRGKVVVECDLVLLESWYIIFQEECEC